MLIPEVTHLSIYPVKSLDRVDLEQVTLLASGALQGDRQYAIFDQSGQFVNGKRQARVHSLRCEFDLARHQIKLQAQASDSPRVFHLDRQREALTSWLSEFFGFPLEIRENLEQGFPDDTLSPGPTIISTATLEKVASWYPWLNLEEVRRRFRANIEISGVPAFWEDQLFTQAGEAVKFQIGNVNFLGINPCQRCIVVTRDSQTGEADAQFQKTFVSQRQTSLPDWVDKSRFNHFYRLAINTRLPDTEGGKVIRLGDRLIINSQG